MPGQRGRERHDPGEQTVRAEITAAAQAKEAGEERTFGLVRATVKVGEARLTELRALVEQFIADATDHPDPDGAWTTIVWASADREQRHPAGPGAVSDTGDAPGRQ